MQKPNAVLRVYTNDLGKYRKTLRVGQEKHIRVLVKRGADWSTWVKAVIVGIYKNVVRVRYRIMVREDWINREAIREEYIRIADLLIWEVKKHGENR